MPKNRQDSDSTQDDLWTRTKSGTYNTVFFSFNNKATLLPGSDYKGPWAMRVPKSPVFCMISERNRALRVYKEINDIPAGLYGENAWVTAFFRRGRQASDEQCSITVLSIYKKTGRILVDACISGNILSDGEKTVCVDTDLALRPSSPVSRCYLGLPDEIKTQAQKMAFYDALEENAYGNFESDYPITTKTILALIYLEKHLPDADIDRDTITPDIIDALSWCRRHRKTVSKETLSRLIQAELEQGIIFKKDCIEIFGQPSPKALGCCAIL